ncbi:MAG TPA: hypothetical protein VKC89_01720 [Patescibacteria group bacterium]|nr:hypothetical protein [Patescibacteria group bacterium]
MPDLFVTSGKKRGNFSALLKIPEKQGANDPHMFTSFSLYPDGIFFEDKEPDEKILLFLRRHFITNLSWLGLSLVLAIIPFILIILRDNLSFFTFMNLPLRYLTFFTIFYYLLIFTYVFVKYITWYFNIGLITNKRVIDIDFSGLIYTNVAATKISLVQDASYSQVGVVRAFCGYADVLVQTAGSLDNFLFEGVPHPEKVVKIVESLIGEAEKQ